jgi:hypothetical protein
VELLEKTDKELTDEELKRLVDELKDFEPQIPLFDVTVPTFDPRDEADAFDRFKSIWADEQTAPTSGSRGTASITTVSTRPHMRTVVASEESDIGPASGMSEFLDRVPLRSTSRKAGRFAPNCFGSQFLHDPDSEDCGPCKFFEGCKTAVASEMPIIEVTREAHRSHFRRGKLPTADPIVRESLRKLLRGHHLAKFRRALKRRRNKDKTYQQKKRANRDVQKLIEKEYRDRRSALHDAIRQWRKDKFLQQLRGREDKIMAIWEAERLAVLACGPAPSAAQIASAFNETIGAEYLSRHQARAYQILFRKLEQRPHAWKRFVKFADDTIA